MVAEKFKGMVKRCADCGFDLAGGRVEVVPTAHYMMGGMEVEEDTSTALHGLFIAGEDAGGVHGANRLGGNGVANSTVFGGIAGDTMAAFGGGWREPDQAAIEAGAAEALVPFNGAGGDLNAQRERLENLMWDKVGIDRAAGDLKSALDALGDMAAELEATGIPADSRAFNLTWHDWLNLRSQILVSRVIAHAALAREDSRGAHYRSDFPETGDLETTEFTSVSMDDGGAMKLDMKPVEFTIVKPGDSLIEGEAGAPPEVA
jgi:fumarate reductase flavoprotein subunit